jgi:hypothetical protein
MNQEFDLPRLIYLLLFLVLVIGSGFGFSRARRDGRGVLIGIVFWGAMIVAVMLIYEVFN